MQTTNIIDSFAALPVGTWIQILAVNEDPARDEVEKQVGTLALLTNLTERQVLTLPLAEYSALARKAEFLGVVPERIPRAASSYKAGAFTLRPALDLRKITAAQYIDFQGFIQQGEKALVELLSVALVPKGAQYNDGSYDLAEVQDAIRNDISVEQALSLASFFVTRLAGLIRSSRISLSRLARRGTDKEKIAALEEKVTELRGALERLSKTAGAGSPTSTAPRKPSAARGMKS